MLKWGGTEKRGGETKILKGGGGQAGSRGCCLIKGGAGAPLRTMVCLFFPPDISQGVFLEFDHEISLNVAMVLESLMKLCMAAWFFWKNFFARKIVFF